MLLVGDSAANVVYGYDTTVPITVDELLPLVRGVVRGAPHALVVADLPFGTYEGSAEQALATATRFMKEGLAHAVKLEGGERMSKQIAAITSAGIPVMAHVGFTPQSVNSLGGFRVQGRGDAAEQLVADAIAVQEAGAFSVVMEMVPAEIAGQVSRKLTIPTVGIGAGSECDAQYSSCRTWRVTRAVRQPSSSSVSVTSVTNCVPQPQPMHQKFALALSRPQNTFLIRDRERRLSLNQPGVRSMIGNRRSSTAAAVVGAAALSHGAERMRGRVHQLSRAQQHYAASSTKTAPATTSASGTTFTDRRSSSCARIWKGSCRTGVLSLPTLGKGGLNTIVITWATQNGINLLDLAQNRESIDAATSAACPDVRTGAISALEIPDLASGLVGF